VGGQSQQAARLLSLLGEEQQLDISFLPHNPLLPKAFRVLQRIKFVRTLTTTIFYWVLLCWRLPTCDVAHVFSASYYSYLLSAAPAILLSRLFCKKCVLNYRSGEAPDHLKRWPLTTIPIMKLADAIVTPSGFLVHVFESFGLLARAIPNSTNASVFSYRIREPLKPIFLTTRGLEPLYNIGCALRAFARVQAKYPEAKLTIVGDGSCRNDLEKLAESLRLNNVEFLGFVPFEQISALYASSDIYLNSPNIDNAPNSLIEAMAAGLLIVTTNAGGIPYIVTDETTCLMVPCDDPIAMANAALRLLEDPELSRNITMRARAAVEQFSWSSVRTQWLQLYAELTQRT